MKQLLVWIPFVALVCGGWAACSPEDSVSPTGNPGSGVVEQPGGDGESEDAQNPGAGEDSTGEDQNDTNMQIQLTVNGREFAATLETNAAARAFAELLPLEMDLSELNGNEKYGALPQSLPTDTYRPGTIRTGDLMLWGSNTFVLFYETFSTSYSYTRLGRIDDPTGLAEAVGGGSVRIRISR